MDLKIFILIIFSIIGIRLVLNKRLKLNLLDILIISNVLFFGLYPIIDILKQNYDATLSIFIFTISYIILTIALLLLLFNFFITYKLRRTLRFADFIQRVIYIPQKIIAASFFIATGIIFYFFFKYDLIFRIFNEDLAVVNTYKQIILSIVFPLFNLVTVSSFSKILIVKNIKTNFVNFLFLGLITGYWLFYGRRELIFHILIMGLVWFVTSRGRVKPKTIVYSLLGLGLIIIGSNIYQNLRWEIRSYSITKEIIMSKSFLEMAFDFESSDKNLKERTSILPLLSNVIDNFSGDKELSMGEIFLAGIQNAVPSTLYKDKIFIDDDEIVSRQLMIPYTDLGTSLFTSFYVDFGILSFIILPLFLFLYYVFVGLVLFYLKFSRIFFIIVYLIALMTIFNIETSVSGIFTSIRQILLLTLIYFVFKKPLWHILKIRL